ncbi:MAG: hypothetical protein A2231_00815 [Candidatus Firestonebacteria bacterium RIFOXYA2_FULL_40_8]|nr:MAG: hypothetical protein A2231_00815 [Candidatus Firestonebacteria bacterium RIFOXYA2_FULL_40_8]
MLVLTGWDFRVLAGQIAQELSKLERQDDNMKKYALIAALALMSSLVYAKVDATDTKSMKALRADKYAEDLLDTLEIQINVGKNYLQEEDKSLPPAKEPVPSSEDSKKGYLVFFRNYLYDVNPYSNPLKEEIAQKELKVFAALGEFEPIVFSVYPFTNLTGCKIMLSEFVNEKGEKLAPGAFQINDVLFRPQGSGSDPVIVKPVVLEKTREIAKIAQGIPKTIWINVKIPEDAKEGSYKGKITFSPAGKPLSEIPVTVTVLPFKLLQPPDVSWSPIMAGSWNFEELEKEMIVSREHGMTGMVTGYLAPEGANNDDFTKANKVMELAKKTGMTGQFALFNLHIQGESTWESTFGPFGLTGDKLFCQATYDKAKDVIIKTRDNAVKNKWLPYIFYLTTELGYLSVAGEQVYNKTMKSAEQYYKTAREVEGVRLMATFNRPEELASHWDLPTLDEFGANSLMSPDWEKAAKKKPSWICFIGSYDRLERLGHGFYMWRYNIKGIRPWYGHGERNVSILSMYYDKEQHPTVRFERIREGVDDYKYMYTLSEYVKKAKAAGKNTAAAESVMKKVNDQIPESHRKHTPGFDYLKMDDYRWQIGQEILKLAK